MSRERELNSEQSRVGIGYDMHPLTKGRTLVLAGIEIPFEKGLIGHSDGDVLTHAICDVLLGAISLGNIGEYFPDASDKFKNVSSLKLLSEVNKQIIRNNFHIGNIDSTIVIAKPSLIPFVENMRQNISNILAVSVEEISIKPKSANGVGYVGKGTAAEAYAIVNLYHNKAHFR